LTALQATCENKKSYEWRYKNELLYNTITTVQKGHEKIKVLTGDGVAGALVGRFVVAL
jgi:hypothetical protein